MLLSVLPSSNNNLASYIPCLFDITPILKTQADYLYSYGDGFYTNSATSYHHLTQGLSPDMDMTQLVRLVGSSAHMTKVWSTTAEAVRNGGSVLKDHAEVSSHPFWGHFATTTSNFAKATAKQLVKDAKYSIGKNVLDIATGSGGFGIEVLRVFPGTTVTFQDYPNVLKVTEQNVKNATVDMKRASFLPGSFFDVSSNIKKPFQTVLATNIIHHFSPETVSVFLKKSFDILEPKGYIVVAEICTPSTPYVLFEGRSMTRSFSHSMLTWSKEGKAYTFDEISSFLTQSGYKSVKRHHFAPSTTIITARKLP